MQILIEEHQYEAALVDPILKGISNLRDVQNPADLMSARYAILKPKGSFCEGLYKIVNNQYSLLTKEQLMQGDVKREKYPHTPHRNAYFMMNLNGRDENSRMYSDFPFNLNGVQPYKGLTSNPYYFVKLEDLLKL